MYYVYSLTDPRKDNEPFYIGKGKGRRAKHHLHPSSQKSRSFKNAVIKAIQAEGLEPSVVYLHTGLSESEALAKEVELIALYGRRDTGTGILANQTNGGDGLSGYIPQTPRKHTDETKRKMSESHMGLRKGEPGHPRSEETRRKIGESMIGKPGRNKGYRWTEEQKAKLKAVRTPRPSPTKGKKKIIRKDGTFYFAFPGTLDV